MKDIILAENKNPKILNGDFVIADSEQQEIERILVAFKGEFKNDPLIGAEMARMLKARNTRQGITREVSEQLKLDGFHSIDFKIENEEDFTIHAHR